MVDVAINRSERGVVGIVILFAALIALFSYGFADDIARWFVQKLQSIPYDQALNRMTDVLSNSFAQIKDFITLHLP
jgi:hypothetical protein